MLKWISLIGLIAFTSFIQEEEQLAWSENKLTWADFKGDPDYSTGAAATTSSGISYKLSATLKNDELDVDCKVVCYFFPQNSWYKPDKVNKIILAHEQLHFDITELHARKFRKILEEREFTKDVKKEIRRIYATINREVKRMQSNYDAESDFSRNLEKQKEWEVFVQKELLKFKEYQ